MPPPPQERINSPEALAAAAAEAAAAAAAAAAEAKRPLHEENDWGIEVMADEPAAGPTAAGTVSGSAAAAALPAGVEFSMPAAGGVDAATLQAEGVEATEASLDELTGMLAMLGGVDGK